MTLSKLQEEKESYCKSLREKVKSLINEKDSIMGRNKSLEEEKNLYKVFELFKKTITNVMFFF